LPDKSPPPPPVDQAAPEKIGPPPKSECPPDEAEESESPVDPARGSDYPPPSPPATDDIDPRPTAVSELSAAAQDEYATGNFWFERAAFDLAVDRFEQFLKLAPRATQAAEVRYKMGTALLALDSKQEAQAVFAKLVRVHPDSPWSTIVVSAHLDEKALASLIKEKYAKAHHSRTVASAQQARDLILVYRKRFGTDENRPECAYRAGVCCQLCNDIEDYQDCMNGLIENCKDSEWAKLALVRLGDNDIFCRHMDELIKLRNVDDENLRLFLEMAEKYYPELQGSEKLKCRFFQARALFDDDKPRALHIFQTLVERHPKSPWAAEAAFRLAEHDYTEGRLAKAQQAFQKLAARYPNSPRARCAKEWAAWIDQHKECRDGIQEFLAANCERLTSSPCSLAASLTIKTDAIKQPLIGKFGMQKDRMLIDLRFRDTIIFFANNQDGTWFLAPTQKYLYKITDFTQPLPKFVVRTDPSTKQASCFFGLTTDDDDPGTFVQLPPETAPWVAAEVMRSSHVHREFNVAKNGTTRTIYHFEDAGWQPEERNHVRVEIEGDAVREIRLEMHGKGNKNAVIVLSDIRFCEPIPEDFFALPALPHKEVRDADSINRLDMFAQWLQLLSAVAEGFTAEATKKHGR
jgi:TolA-binding protein